MNKPCFFWLLPIFTLLATCGKHNNVAFTVSEINFFQNLKESKSDSVINLALDMNEAVLNGIEIPTRNQTPSGYFTFSFKIKNTSNSVQPAFYKFYYQNETYKFKEGDEYDKENFYGSWDNAGFIFKSTTELKPGEEVLVKDSFKIVGNPRNERSFFGSNNHNNPASEEAIASTINYIKSIPEWLKAVTASSQKNKVPLEEQLYMDALWSLNDKQQRDSSTNNRWKRNPRVGRYQFMLVVTNPEDFDKIPAEVKDLSRKDLSSNFVNPFTYFSDKNLSSLNNTTAIHLKNKLNVHAKIDFSKGIFVNLLTLNRPGFSRDFYLPQCNESYEQYKKAHVELFVHNINRDFALHNVPVTADVTKELSRKEYSELVKKYTGNPSLVNTFVSVTDCPCKNLTADTLENSITLTNPGNDKPPFKKEQVGLVTRIGFTYGKFRAKIKFPEMLSEDHVWNGITNAFWMIAQDVNADWNLRRPCNSEIAYIPKQEPDNDAALKHSLKQISYSEIDFEIVKDSEFWPRTSYSKSNTKYKEDSPKDDHNVMVTCTNWDMACHEPKSFFVGANEYDVDGKKYLFHRWNHYYKALTTKVPIDHNEIFKKPYYYFEIEWLPEKIIWKIGPEKDKMRAICVMDKGFSAIPNNQMLMVITQEWHNQEWWPTAPFKQNFIPFPKNNIIGKVLEIEIE